MGEDGPGGGGAVGGQGDIAAWPQELEKLPQKRFFHHHGDKGAVIKAAGKVQHGRQVRIAVKDVVQRFPHGVAVNVVHGLGAQRGPVEVGQDGIVEGDVGLLGIEQDPVAIKGYQLEQDAIPWSGETVLSGGVATRGRRPRINLLKVPYYQIHLNYQCYSRKRGQVRGDKPAGNFWAPRSLSPAVLFDSIEKPANLKVCHSERREESRLSR